MLKVFATDVVISKGYDGAPALKFSEKGDSVRFRIGKKVYDTRANNNYRWVNLAVKAFGTVCERIKKMQLKESSYVNIVGWMRMCGKIPLHTKREAPWWLFLMRSSTAFPEETNRRKQEKRPLASRRQPTRRQEQVQLPQQSLLEMVTSLAMSLSVELIRSSTNNHSGRW